MLQGEFHVLPIERQIELLYEEAVYLLKRKYERFDILLYQLDGFYVEIYYKQYRQHIHSIYSFESTDVLDRYLHLVDVEELTNFPI